MTVGWGGDGGGKRQGLGPRNNVLTTCKSVTLRGGQQVIGVFPTLNILIEARSKLAEEMIKKLIKQYHAFLFFLHIVFVFWY